MWKPLFPKSWRNRPGSLLAVGIGGHASLKGRSASPALRFEDNAEVSPGWKHIVWHAYIPMFSGAFGSDSGFRARRKQGQRVQIQIQIAGYTTAQSKHIIRACSGEHVSAHL